MGRIGAIWGLAGVSALLTFAIVRLAGIGVASFDYGYQWYHWLALAACVVFMAYSEGYLGFQKAFSPRFAARLKHIHDNPKLVHSLLAPIFGMGYFHATRRRLVTSYLVTATILVFVYVAHHLPQPWRGIVDIGVVVGLGWGLISALVFSIRALRAGHFPYSPELPEAGSKA